MPHLLCGYLYELATRFTSFYEACPILTSSADVRERRLVLAKQTADTLRNGLDLLGIGVVEQM
jgi:arginyl-tRNA synthetase